jgi:hypothetical protein
MSTVKNNVIYLASRRPPESNESAVFSRINYNGILHFGYDTHTMTVTDTLRHLMALQCLMGKMIQTVQAATEIGNVLITLPSKTPRGI